MSHRLTLISAVAALALTGCNASVGRSTVPGTLEHDTQAIELGNAEMVRVEMRMGAGELNVGGGSPRLLDAEFEFDHPSSKPVVRYQDGSFRGLLTVEQ